jgi:hypothetical protein
MSQVVSRKEDIHGNHWSQTATQFSLTTDWLMAGNYLNPADLKLAHQFLAVITRTILGYSYGSGAPTINYNSPYQFYPDKPDSLMSLRAMGNNYTMSKMLYLVAASLTFNDNQGDDPDLPTSCHAQRYQVCPDYTAGSLHAYWKYFAGAMLYRMYAHLEDPTVSWPAYKAAFSNLPQPPMCTYTDGSHSPCLGDGRGGESSEGSWYGYSLFKLRYALNIAQTAGYDDPLLYGPQISLGTSSWWDLKYVFDLAFLTGFGPNGNSDIPAWNYLTTGDSDTYYRAPADFQTETSMMIEDSYSNRKDRENALRWIVVNTAFGGPLGKSGGCKSYCGFDAELLNDFASPVAMDLMIAMPAGDPVLPLPADPRPSLPTDLYNGSFNHHIILRSSYSEKGTLFSAYCPNALIDHEHEFCGRFDIFSNGEYITKGRTEFNDYNNRMSSAPQSNTMSLANVTGSGCVDYNCIVYDAVRDGGQFWLSEQQGLNLITHSELPSYAAMLVNDTPVYNGKWVYHEPHDIPGYDDVKAASRSLIYLRDSNQVVFYDRGTTGHPADKAISLITTGSPTVTGQEASWLTRSSRQKVYFTSLLPSHADLAKVALIEGGKDQTMDWEPAATIRVDVHNSTSARFLSVLDWGESSFRNTSPTLVQSSTGEGFDGAKLGAAVIMFMRDWPAKFTGVTYPALGSTTEYISDLMPDTTYEVEGDGTPATAETDRAGVLVFKAAGTGSIRVAPKK